MGATFLRTWLLLGPARRAAFGTERKLHDLDTLRQRGRVSNQNL